MSACEACWAEASQRAAYGADPVVDIYLRVLREWDGFADNPTEPCGGIFVNGAMPKTCEVHLLPWGHKVTHPHA